MVFTSCAQVTIHPYKAGQVKQYFQICDFFLGGINGVLK